MSWQDIVIGVGLIAIMITVFIVTLGQMGNYFGGSVAYNTTKEKCCGGYDCTDTYYSEEDNKCHSTFEYNFPTGWKLLAIAVIVGIILVVLRLAFPSGVGEP